MADPSHLISKFMTDNWWVPITASALYVMMVFAGPRLMAGRGPIASLKLPMALWNLFLSLFSLIGSIILVPVLAAQLINNGVRATLCEASTQWYMADTPGLLTALFCLSKVPELLDTFFLIVNKKDVIFLHWYHHITVMFYCWHSFSLAISTGLWFATMNYIVHMIMYMYFFLMTVGYRRVQRYGSYITQLQIAQMVMGIAVTVSSYGYYLLEPPGPDRCHIDPLNARCGLVMYASYLVLFMKLYIDSARRRRAAAAVKAKDSK